MHLGEFQREVEYLDPGLPVEQELVERHSDGVTEQLSFYAAEDLYADDASPVKV